MKELWRGRQPMDVGRGFQQMRGGWTMSDFAAVVVFLMVVGWVVISAKRWRWR